VSLQKTIFLLKSRSPELIKAMEKWINYGDKEMINFCLVWSLNIDLYGKRSMSSSNWWVDTRQPLLSWKIAIKKLEANFLKTNKKWQKKMMRESWNYLNNLMGNGREFLRLCHKFIPLESKIDTIQSWEKELFFESSRRIESVFLTYQNFY